MPRSPSKQKRTPLISPQPYDPNSEKDQSNQTAALHFELLRRNGSFQQLARRWIADPAFRIAHSESSDYHHSQIHFPRCALDWMISGAARVELARVQLAAGRWFKDNRFNFGPIIATQTLHPLDARRETMPNAFSLQPLPDAPPPVQLEQTWPNTPGIFRQQFSVAVHDGGEFQVVTEQVHEAGDYLHWAAARLRRNDAPEKLPQIIEQLSALGEHFRNLAEFQRIFAVPNASCPPGKFNEYLDAIHNHCSEAGQIVGGYSAHASWLGTKDQWRYFLIAERHGWDPKNLGHMYELARIYSQDLRNRRYEKSARRDAQPHGFKGDAVSSKVIKDRRSTVRRSVVAIQEWIENIYPPDRWLEFTRPPAQRP
jgi:hypothetical protein